MNVAIITDSTCDIRHAELEQLSVERVPLYVQFQDKMFKDWLEITPKEIIDGVAQGADLPSTSQPSPQDFAQAYKDAAAAGADHILCLTISSELSGTHQSANLAKEQVDVPVTVFDSRAASIGIGTMVQKAAKMRDAGASVDEIVKALEHIRDTNFALFTVDSLDFLQKNGRIGQASALVGSLLNIKPLLSVQEGKIAPVGRARGNKKALKELVNQVVQYAEQHEGKLVVNFIHVLDESAAVKAKDALEKSGLEFVDAGTYELGAVIACHVGPGTYGLYLHTEP